MRLRLTKIDEFQFITCLKHEVWGRKADRFKDWEMGDYLAFTVDKALAGLAVVAGKPYVSTQLIWENDLYPHRIPIAFVHAMETSNRLPVSEDLKNILRSAWGPNYGFGILHQLILEDANAEHLAKLILSRQNDLLAMKADIESRLAAAKGKKAVAKKSRRFFFKGRRP